MHVFTCVECMCGLDPELTALCMLSTGCGTELHPLPFFIFPSEFVGNLIHAHSVFGSYPPPILSLQPLPDPPPLLFSTDFTHSGFKASKSNCDA